MKSSLQWMLTLLLALTVTVCQAQEKFALTTKGQAGQIIRYRSDATLKVDAGGQTHTFEIKETEKAAITDVAANGNITFESETESSEVMLDGQKFPDDDDKSKTTKVIRPDGTLVSYKSTSKTPDQSKVGARLYYTTTPLFGDKPVGVGEKWTKEIKGDAEMGTVSGKAEFEVVGTEKVGTTDAIKIKMVYAETEGDKKATTSGMLWVEKSSGDVLKSDFDVENLTLSGGVTASGKLRSERVEGAPLKADVKPGAAKVETKPEPKKEKTIDEVVKDYEKIPGQFTLYKKKESGRETVYMEIKEEQLNKFTMLQATAGTGTAAQVVAGDPINDLLFKFMKVGDDRVQIVVPNYNFRAAAGTPIERSVRRSFADAIIEQFKIEAQQPDRKSLLINVSDLFRGDISQVTQIFSSGGGLLGGGGFSLNREKTYVQAYKNFPENLVVETLYHFAKSGGGGNSLLSILSSASLADPRSAPIKVVYNLFQLKDEGYRPRLADPRVGYFLTEFQDFTRDDLQDMNTRYIYRWNLEKADPKAKLSAPKKPIVFWLDNAIPLEYRDAVRDGLLFWNKAFEKIGIKDAVVVKQMPDNADWDTADMRYNVIRWVTSPDNAYAVALFRVNPMTGQIVNASITVDAGIVRFTKLEHKVSIEPAAYFSADDPTEIVKRLQSLKAHRTTIGGGGLAACDMASEKMEQAWYGLNALRAFAPNLSKKDEKEYTLSFIRDVVSHEMGHIMGLRHNFIASTYHTLDELKDANKVKATGVTASVMDYTPFNISALKQKNVDFFMPCVGPYDMWAIEYGYTPIESKTPEGEKYRLTQIATKCTQPGLAFQSDEVADSFDPAVTRFDLGKAPLDYWDKNIQIVRYLALTLGNREPKNGESYWEFTRSFQQFIGQYARSAAVASRYVGGLHVNRNFKGDPNEKPTLAPATAADQRKALTMLNTYIFAENAFTFPKSYYTKMTSNPNESFLDGMLASKDFPLMDTFSSIQKAALTRIFRPDVLHRIANNEFKNGAASDSFTLPYLFNSVGWNLWTELEGHRNIGVLRRQIQRAHLDSLISMVVTLPAGAPEDAKMLAWDQLRNLKGRIAQAQRRGGYDTYTRVHLDEAAMRIARAMEARQTVGSQGGGRAVSLLELLSGGEPASRK